MQQCGKKHWCRKISEETTRSRHRGSHPGLSTGSLESKRWKQTRNRVMPVLPRKQTSRKWEKHKGDSRQPAGFLLILDAEGEAWAHRLTRGAAEVPSARGCDASGYVQNEKYQRDGLRMFNLLKIGLYGQDRAKCQGDDCSIRAVITGKSVIKAACSTKVASTFRQSPSQKKKNETPPKKPNHQGRLTRSDTHCFHSAALK